MEQQIERIKLMEKKMDEVTPEIKQFSKSLEKMEKLFDEMKVLNEYSSGEWKKDYEADEQGKIPKDLKRGILSEDALYNVLGDYNELGKKMIEIGEKIKNLH